MARLYASDVVYKDYTTPLIANALHGAGIAVGGVNGESIYSGQFVSRPRMAGPDVRGHQARRKVPDGRTGKLAPGLHGHELNSVSVGGTSLQTGSTNTLPGQSARRRSP